jgi:hypothetical protein
VAIGLERLPSILGCCDRTVSQSCPRYRPTHGAGSVTPASADGRSSPVDLVLHMLKRVLGLVLRILEELLQVPVGSFRWSVAIKRRSYVRAQWRLGRVIGFTK